ncbi:translation initiation factor eIF4A [Gryganskiella cystojenkinii]|nr:translation initiation factor eIF4A [Gryganskiella cystojenkinii]
MTRQLVSLPHQEDAEESSTPDSAASKTGTPVTLSSKPDTTAKDPANNSNNAYKDGASTNDVPPTQRPSASSGVSEFKRTQQLVTRSPRSPRSPRRGFERGPETRQTPRENVRQENPPSAAGATLKTEGTSNMSSVALHTLDTIQSVDKPNRKSDAEFETPSLSTAETSITTSEDPQASSTNTSKKRKSARKNQKNDDEASSTISASSGKDTLSNSKSSATPAAATSGPGDRTAESAATDTTASDIKAQGESAWVPKSKANRTLPKERTGVSPGYLGKNPIPNFQKTQRPGQDSRQESQVRQRITHKDAPPTSTTQAADVPSKAANRKEHKDDTSKPSESGWGETSETPVASAPSAEGWGETSTSTLRWGEEVPWETQVGLNQLSTPTWVNESSDHQSQAPRSAGDRNIRDDRSNISDRPSQKHMEHGSGKDRSGTAINSSGDARYNGARFSPEYQQRGSHNERVNGTRDLEQERTFTSSAQSKDARSSLDKRNERLALQRGPHPKEYSKDDRRTRFSPGAPQELSDTADDSTADVGPRRPAQKADASSFGSSDVRRDSRYNNSNGREAFGSNTTRSNHLRSRSPPTPYQQKSQSSGFLASQDTNRNAAGKPTKSKLGPGNIRLPLLSTSLECQMSWQEMGLKPCVLESIKKAGLTRPSNTQKLMMKPFAEGKDVIAQSQSQNDRTNTLAMALLQKLSASAQMEKRCKAVVICSDGISPNKVHKDLEVWFESCPGLRCVFLTDPSDIALSDSEQAKQVVVTTLGPLMEVLNKGLIEMTAVETVMISMRSDELVGFDAFKQFWAMLPRGAQVVLMTGLIQPSLQAIKDYNFSANAAVVRADELTLQWSEHYYVDLLESALERRERQQRERSNRKRYPNGGRKDEPEVPDEKNQGEQDEEDEKDTYDRRWEILTNLLSKNPEISHVVIVTQSQSLTQALTDQLKEQNFPVLSIWSMADKTKVVKQFNRPDRCILVLESVLMENLDLDHYSLIINYEMPKRSVHYISSFGPFGRSGLRTTMINFCVTQDTKQRLLLAEIEAMHDIRIQKMTLQEADSRI